MERNAKINLNIKIAFDKKILQNIDAVIQEMFQFDKSKL